MPRNKFRRRRCAHSFEISISGPPPLRPFNVGHVGGISDGQISSTNNIDVRKYTHFLLPYFNTKHDILSISWDEFWKRIDSLHKERWMLVAYFCGRRVIRESYVTMAKVIEDGRKGGGNGGDGDDNGDVVKCFMGTPVRKGTLAELIESLVEANNVIFTAMRYALVIEEANSTNVNAQMVLSKFSRLVSPTMKCKYADQCNQLLDMICGQDVLKKIRSDAERLQISVQSVREMLLNFTVSTLKGITDMVDGYVGANEKNRLDWYLMKLRTAVPRWREEDRAIILRMIEAGENAKRGWYVEKLYRTVGMERFKEIAFGKEKFCAKCRQSSYTSKDRLWTCKRCVLEKVHPRAQYCNAECQRAHWLEHKKAVHTDEACFNCGRKSGGETKLGKCKLCVDGGISSPAIYCSVRCQKAHWPMHKPKAHRRKETKEEGGAGDS